MRGSLPGLALLALLPVLLLSSALRPGWSLVPLDAGVPREPRDAVLWDAYQQDVPWKLEAARSYRAGRVPLYSFGAFCGSPLLANDQSAPLYPGNMPYLALPPAPALTVVTVLHLVLAAWGARAAVLALGGPALGGVVAGAAFALSGPMMAFLPHPQMTAALALSPWLVWSVLRAGERPAPARLARVAAVSGLLLLSGHLQYAAFAALAAAAFAASGRAPGRTLLAMSLGLGLSAAQILPTLAYTTTSARKDLAVGDGAIGRYQHSMPASRLATIAWPEAFGHPERGAYAGAGNFRMFAGTIGIVPLALALGAPRRRGAAILAALAGLALLWSLGTLLYAPLHALPGWSSLKPARCLALFALAGTGLAGLGLADGAARWRGILLAALALAGAAAVAVPVLAREPSVRPAALAGLARAAAALGALALLRWRGARPAAIALLAAAEMLLWARPLARAYPVSVPYEDAETAAIRTAGARFSCPSWSRVPPNTAMALGLEDARGTDSFIPRRYHALAAALDPASDDMVRVRLARGLPLPVHALLSPLVLAPAPAAAAAAGLSPLGDGTVPLMWDPRSPGTAFVPSRPRRAPDAARALRAVTDPAFVPGENDVVEGVDPPATPEARVLSVARTPNRIDLTLAVRAPSLVVVAHGYQEGWRALGRAGRHQVHPADAAFLGLVVPAGETRVELRYEPTEFRLGLFLSCLSGLLTLIMLLPPAGPQE